MNNIKKSEKIAVTSIIILVLVGATLACFILFPTPITLIRRHVNPSLEAERKPYSGFLTLLVLAPLKSLAVGNYSDTVKCLKTLMATYIPETLKFVINRFTQLLNQTANLLEKTENLLNMAENLIDVGREEDAKPILKEASVNLAQANLTYNELEAASDELTRRFSLQRSQIAKGVEDVAELIEKLYHRLNDLLNRLEKQKNLEETILEIDVFPKTIWTGGKITVIGRLYTPQRALSSKKVVILIDGDKGGEAKTLEDGAFTTQLNLPYIYKHKVIVRVKYTPTEDEASLYKPAISNPIKLSLLYIEPRIMIEPVGAVFPGKGFILKGVVKANQSLPYSTIKILWAGTAITASLKEGKFETMLHVPENIPEGKQTLKVETQAWGIFAPAQAKLAINVQRLPLNITIETPPFILSGVGAPLRGRIIYGDEVFNVTVKLAFLGRTQTLKTLGEFHFQLNPSLTLLTNYYDYEIYVAPSLPWYRSSTIKGSILVLNPITITLPTGLILVLALRLLLFQRAEQSGVGEGEALIESRGGRLPEKSFTPEELRWVIESYWQAVVIIESISGIKMKPSMTMREYFASAAPKIGELYNDFKTLTFTAEKVLYAREVPAEELESARRAINNLKVRSIGANI